MNILVSACLLGINCRYDGTGELVEDLKSLMSKHHLIPVCPEIYGGLTTPRKPSERMDGRIIDIDGNDVTEYFEKGAKEAIKLAEMYQCSHAILKERSPSCGYGKIYDGTFSRRLVDGNGVLAEYLLEKGIIVLGETGIKELL